jgi:hypothetical protein
LQPEWVSAGSGVVTATAALVALIFGIYQVSSARRQQREATAKHLYGEAMRMGLNWPDLAVPDYAKIAAEDKYKQYQFYLAHLLYACEEILMHSDDPLWRQSIKYNLALHAPFLASERFRYGDGFYAEELVVLMKQAVKEHGSLVDGFLRHGEAYQPPSLATV